MNRYLAIALGAVVLAALMYLTAQFVDWCKWRWKVRNDRL